MSQPIKRAIPARPCRHGVDFPDQRCSPCAKVTELRYRLNSLTTQINVTHYALYQQEKERDTIRAKLLRLGEEP